MANMRAQVAYVKGLLSGLGTDNDSKEMRLVTEVVKVLSDFAERLDEMRATQNDMEEYLQALDEDLYAVETMVLGEEETEDMEDADFRIEPPGWAKRAGVLEQQETVAQHTDVF